MMRKNVKLLTWMMLIGFTVHAVIPAAAQAWLLCIGCDDFGVAITQVDVAGSAENCCPGDGAEGAPKGVESHAGDCGCIDLTLDKASVVASLTNPQQEQVPTAIQTAVPDLRLLGVAGAISWRGPPGLVDSRHDRTLFGQRALLLL